ncbi:NAD-dependent epimerase/dehydratase family protein [Enhygromyxa salina]|uniref:dTDP-L-rhamnose 4-epimerase n=1 Tax=Enhygromyxa salina TaxID=215803 RepID=A0A2S9XTQ8_9BACT|nr:NAD-dependent epimerase/dehydratase family protein [Enhygromyxa salina]PRP96259.1 dTDP-L-rhamnose 4-epimerase [Enhygromyxa salina]
MASRILITGGAGFIGSHLADELLRAGYRVRVLDSLSPQVHGAVDGPTHRPAYLAKRVELIRGDVRDPAAVRLALLDVDAVFHLAAAVGVGQSMYELVHYTSTNSLGTAVLLEALLERPVAALIVASSMSLYGEGRYLTQAGAVIDDVCRTRQQLERGEWEPRDADGEALQATPTPEHKPPNLASVYALNKYDQERMCLLIGEAYGIKTAALRLFNVYGPRQALSNPYTGVLAIFAARLLNDRAPIVFEDGEQRRDFVHVHDVARAFRLALELDAAAGQTFNIGSGRSFTIREIARRVATALGKSGREPQITGEYRVGDIRHCFADISRARRLLGYSPSVEFEDGLAELAAWLRGQAADDKIERMRSELASRGLTLSR